MAKQKPKRIQQAPNVGAEETPPGATRQAFDRETPPKDGSKIDAPTRDEAETVDHHEPTEAEVVGTPDRRHDVHQNAHRGFAPGAGHRGDSTVGADPDAE